LKSIGSDTINNEMKVWAEGFQRHYPNVSPEMKVSTSAVAWLLLGAMPASGQSRARAVEEPLPSIRSSC